MLGVNILRGLVLVLFCLGTVGCHSMMHPRADEFYQQAKGANAVETGLNLSKTMDATIQQLVNSPEKTELLDELHDQFHALHGVFCEMSEEQSKTIAYIHSKTLIKELKTVFHRLWKYREDERIRALHLGLFRARLVEFRLALEAIPT